MLMMWAKRFVPFALTFALGLLIASLFVSVAMPKLKARRSSYEYRQSDCGMRYREREARRRERELERDLDALETARQEALIEAELMRLGVSEKFNNEYESNGVPSESVPRGQTGSFGKSAPDRVVR